MGATTTAAITRHKDVTASTSRLCLAAAAILGIATVLVVIARQRWTSELVSVLAPYLSSDDVVTAEGIERLRRWLLRLAFVFSIAAIALVVAAPAERRHRLRHALLVDDLLPGRSPWRTLFGSCALGGAVLTLWVSRTMLPVEWLFRKEGPLESMTALLLVIAAFSCALATRHWLRRRETATAHWLAATYALLAVGTFLVAMEEISWGQHLLGFSTPDTWTRLNYQQETTLHNLADKDTLERSLQIVSLALALAVSVTWVILAQTHSRRGHILLPHPALVPLAWMIGLSGTLLHAEIAEFLIALFAMCYALRAHRIAASDLSQRLRPSGLIRQKRAAR